MPKRYNFSHCAACAAVLFTLNLVLCYRLFGLEASVAVYSTDANYISISRYVLKHWGDLSWWPIWYGGIPGTTVYPPLLHALTALLAAAERVSVPLAHHQLSGVGYALGPVTLFLLVYRLSQSLAPALVTGLCYSLLSPASWLVPWARDEVGGIWRPLRLHVLVGYGDAPHVFALMLVPLAILALDEALQRRTWPASFLAALAMSSVLLTNWVGTVALAGAFLAYLLATDFAQWWLASGISLAAYGLAGPWLSPRSVLLVAENSQTKSGAAVYVLEYAVLMAMVFVGVKAFLQRREASPVLQFAVFLLLFPGTLPLALFWFGISVIPEPHRYLYELELAICLLLGIIITRWPRLLIAFAAVLAVWQIGVYWIYARAAIRPADIAHSMEYQTAMWLNQNTGGSRVYARGTVSWWLNAFTDVPQLGGGVSAAIPGRTMFQADDTLGGKASDPDGRRTLQWLRAYGVDYAVVGPLVAMPYIHPERFDKIADKLWSYGKTSVYRISRQSRSLAHVIPRRSYDLAGYVDAIENSVAPQATFTWINLHEARVSAVVPPGQVVSVQVSYAPGWHARVNGVSRAVVKDPFGLMVIDPQTSGPCIIELTFGRSVESALTSVAAISVLLLFVIMTIRAIIVSYGDPSVRAPQ